ncbi:hypothetical protein K2Z83_19730 [Oscillochloris sp. ZM17-4]|uniref:hypothetical protein n=1 Tax=Oscillochloris sp. ZM17-4 TaxID=2866714 RepID=UPI001C730EC9|nr:hypothetical protein [Oscillochloris sp. ZM17-4]MBX0329899.1 hypothetical protein [Oscillochloris sp. ZM17-4]
MDVLISLAKAVLEKVLSQLNKVIADIAEQGLAPLQRLVQGEVEKVWRGKGAQAFIDELSSIFIPGVGRVSDNLTKLHGDIQSARDRIEQADREADQMIRGRLEEKARFF